MTANCVCPDDEDAAPCEAEDCTVTFRMEVGGPDRGAAPEPEQPEEPKAIPCDCWKTLRIDRRGGYEHWSDCPDLRRLRRACDACDLRPGFPAYHCPTHRGEAR